MLSILGAEAKRKLFCFAVAVAVGRNVTTSDLWLMQCVRVPLFDAVRLDYRRCWESYRSTLGYVALRCVGCVGFVVLVALRYYVVLSCVLWMLYIGMGWVVVCCHIRHETHFWPKAPPPYVHSARGLMQAFFFLRFNRPSPPPPVATTSSPSSSSSPFPSCCIAVASLLSAWQ